VEISYIASVHAAHAEYTATSVIPPIGAVADVNSLPCHIPQFAPCISQGGGQKAAAHTRVNLGPHHISETVTARRLKFDILLHIVKYAFAI